MNALEHFVSLARTGKRNAGASGGEKRAYRLAKCVIDDVPGLDQDAVEGLKLFIDTCGARPSLADDWINAPAAK